MYSKCIKQIHFTISEKTCLISLALKISFKVAVFWMAFFSIVHCDMACCNHTCRAVGRYENPLGWGANSNPRPFEGEGFASIPAKIWGGGGIAPLTPLTPLFLRLRLDAKGRGAMCRYNQKTLLLLAQIVQIYFEETFKFSTLKILNTYLLRFKKETILLKKILQEGSCFEWLGAT